MHALVVEHGTSGNVGGCEVGEHRIQPQVRAGEQLGQHAAEVVEPVPEPVHAGVDLEVVGDGRPMPCRRRLHRARRARRRDRRGQRILEQPVEIADAQRPEHQNRHAHAGAAQHDALFDIGAREHRRACLFERQRDTIGAMPVGIRLDDRNDVRRSRRACCAAEKIANRAEVAPQRAQVDVRDGAADHAAPYAPCARLANRVCSRRKARRTTPVGPLRCLATINSAVPASGLFGSLLYTSSR